MLITNIQRFSYNDGPGIRTTVYLKGCPLRCLWCQNPETQHSRQEFYYYSNKCMCCGHCAEICPEGAISFPGQNGEFPKRDRNKCTMCMKCVEECPYDALELVGEEWTIDEVMEEVEGDRLFYDNSGGGLTVCGGEPLYSPEFTAGLLKKAREAGIHTCLDTSGYADWEDFQRVLRDTDMVLFDIKCMDSERHRKLTGVSNKKILQNLHKIQEEFGSTMRVRLRSPTIPGVNDHREFFERVAEEALSLGDILEGIDVLPFHNWAEGKFEQLDRYYYFGKETPMQHDDVTEFVTILKKTGYEVTVGG